MLAAQGAVFVSLVAFSLAVDLPSSITPCKRSDPDVSKCVTKALGDAAAAFKDGNEELKIAPIDPYVVPELRLVQSKTNKNFQLDWTFKNLILKGLSESKFDNVKVDVSDKEIVIKGNVLFPTMVINSDYEMLGKMMLFNINAKDKAYMEFTGLGGEFSIVLTPDESEEIKHLVLQESKFKVLPSKAVKFRIENLVEGNKELSEKMNKIIEENVNVLQGIFQPSIQKFFTTIFDRAVSKVFSAVPMDVAFPP